MAEMRIVGFSHILRLEIKLPMGLLAMQLPKLGLLGYQIGPLGRLPPKILSTP